MNRKGGIFFGVAIGIFLFAMGVLIMPFLADTITDSRDKMDCTNSSISDGTKLYCLGVTDLAMPYFILFFTTMALGLIIGSRI